MSNDTKVEKNVWERLFKLWATICKLLVDGKRDLEKVAGMLQQIVDERDSNPYLRKIAEGVLGATTGERILSEAGELFPGYLDSDFINWGTDVVGSATEGAPFEVFEMIKDGTFGQIFGGFGVDLKKLCWSQDQIITFVEDHKDLLHPGGWATFFLFSVKFEEGTENEHEEFFVANVHRGDGGRLRACVFRLSGDGVWSAVFRGRFVLPQLAL